MLMRESDLSPVARQFLFDIGCTNVYGEVGNIDLVGKKGSILYAVELKTTLNTKVMEQALDRKKYCNYVYIAIPYEKSKPYYQLSIVYRQFIESHGIGLVYLYKEQKSKHTGTMFRYYDIVKHPKINRQTQGRNYINSKMGEFNENKDGGLTTDKMETPYKIMVEQVKNYMQRVSNRHGNDGWLTVDEILNACDRVKKHYSNPRSSLWQLLNSSWNQSWVDKGVANKKYRYKGVSYDG